MKNRITLLTISTIILFLFSAICFFVMRITAKYLGQGGMLETSSVVEIYYFNIIFGLIGLALYNILKANYDKTFNRVYKTYAVKKKKVYLWITYIIISAVFWCFVFITSKIGGGLTNLYMFENKILQGLYIIDVLIILPLWNIVYHMVSFIKLKVTKN